MTLDQSRLRRETERWVQAGIIAPEAAEQILALYPVSGRNYWVAAFAVIGAVLVLGGISLLIAHNWHAIPAPIKLAALVVLLVGSYAIGVETGARGMGRAWQECAFLAAAVFPLLGLMLVSQIFHVEGKATNLVAVWLVAIAALPWLSRAVSAWVMWLLAWMSLLVCGINDEWLGREWDLDHACVVFVVWGLACAGVSQAWPRLGAEFRVQRDVGEFWGLLVGSVAWYVLGLSYSEWFGVWLLLFLGCLGLIYAGFLRGRPHQVNLGFVLVALLILSTFFRLVGSMLDTGMIFLIGGLAILFGVWGLNRARVRVLGGMSGREAA